MLGPCLEPLIVGNSPILGGPFCACAHNKSPKALLFGVYIETPEFLETRIRKQVAQAARDDARNLSAYATARYDGIVPEPWSSSLREPL